MMHGSPETDIISIISQSTRYCAKWTVQVKINLNEARIEPTLTLNRDFVISTTSLEGLTLPTLRPAISKKEKHTKKGIKELKHRDS